MNLEEIKDRNNTLSSNVSLTTLHKDIQWLISEVERLHNMLKPMEESARKMLEIEKVMPTLLNGGSRGAERCAEICAKKEL